MNDIEVYGRKIDWKAVINEIESYIKTDKNLSVGEEHSLKFSLELLLKERQSDKERIEELEEELEEKDMQHELELIGKEEYTKASMGEIIEQYYTANEDCIPKSLIKEKIEELNTMIIETHRGNLQRYTVSEILSFQRFCEELLGEEK